MVSAQDLECGAGFGQIFFQGIEKRGDAPEKHSGVPAVIAGSHVFFSECELRVFREGLNRENGNWRSADGLGGALDVAETGVGARRRNAEDDHAAGFASEIEREAGDLAIFLRLADVKIGGKNGHERIAVLFGVTNVNGGERDGGSGAAADGLGENVLARRAGNCLRTAADCSALVTVQMRSAGMSGVRRATVCRSMESAPMMLSNCLGVRVRLRGQKRVPRPPARITA